VNELKRYSCKLANNYMEIFCASEGLKYDERSICFEICLELPGSYFSCSDFLSLRVLYLS